MAMSTTTTIADFIIRHKTGIQWTHRPKTIGATWNTVTGCSHESDGCRFCYAEAISLRFKRSVGPWTHVNAPRNVILHPEKLAEPLRWKQPHTIFANSMSDLFHEQVPDEFIEQVFGVMAMTPQHTYIVLTKRPKRMLEWVRTHTHESCAAAVCAWGPDFMNMGKRTSQRVVEQIGAGWPWPLPNVWLGVSVENQRAVVERIPLLLLTPAKVRFLSCEPLLESVDLRKWLAPGIQYTGDEDCPRVLQYDLHWVIAGGESGPRARPMAQAWAEDILDQCQYAGVPAFMKQMGTRWAKDHHAREGHGGNPDEWPEHLRIREWPATRELSEVHA